MKAFGTFGKQHWSSKRKRSAEERKLVKFFARTSVNCLQSKMMEDDIFCHLDKLRALQDELQSQISESPEEDVQARIASYIRRVDGMNEAAQIVDLDTGLEWVNTSGLTPSALDFRGRVVVLDFFTFCCVNCIHVLPYLQSLEEEHRGNNGFLVVGVHSAKFEHEKKQESLESAVQKLSIVHPVINDASYTLWRRFQVQCWPTLLVVGPRGNLLLRLEGEGGVALLAPFCQVALEYFKDSVKCVPFLANASPDLTSRPSTLLRFPAKISAHGPKFAITDTGNHRVLMVSLTEGNASPPRAKVLCVAGGGTAGFRDGSLKESRFCDPHGVAWRDENRLFVADTGNHALREIDWAAGTVRTVAGTGEMGQDKAGGRHGLLQPLNSPWDLVVDGDVLYVAMAGSHQVWALLLEDGSIFGKRAFSKGTCVCIAGTGEEGNRNNSYSHRATFAQPSGIAVHSGETLFIADSESSSIRSISLKDGAVRNIVGGDVDPTNLFCFGDEDGIGQGARLQHPLGVAFCRQTGELFVADSYNHKIRVVDISTRTCKTLVGQANHEPNDSSGKLTCLFAEPEGICVVDGCLCVADTNNHCIKLVHLDTLVVEEVELTSTVGSPIEDNLKAPQPMEDVLDTFPVRPASNHCVGSLESPSGGNQLRTSPAKRLPALGKNCVRTLHCVRLVPGASLLICADLPENMSAEAPNHWSLECDGDLFEPSETTEGRITGGSVMCKLLLKNLVALPCYSQVHLSLHCCVCEQGSCKPVSHSIQIFVEADQSGSSKEVLKVPWLGHA